jgi:4-diphosphocytidyl-2-C-methyl-D-erythritol kinase
VKRRLYRCYAKVNLTLEVLGRRPDGYHELASLAHTISLADDLYVEETEEKGEKTVCRAQGVVAELETNLVTHAAELLREWTRARAGTDLTLVKRIPVASGLGGGSSDAATTLVALNRLWGTGLGYRELHALAAQLGSDVPFFLCGGAAVMRGLGTQLEPVRPLVGQWLCLAVLEHDLLDKTARMYAALEETDFSDGQATANLAAGLEAGRPLLPDANLQNAFSRVAKRCFAGLDWLWGAAEEACGRRFHLSGAGPALFALAADHNDARRLLPVLENLGVSAFAVRTVGHGRASAQVAASCGIEYP